ncbi:MAG: MerR family transcriptional regulator [Rhizobiaceae bacterium]
MQIGELAKSLGVTPKTIRHYEKAGLIPESIRDSNGYRNFSAEAVQRARLVVGLRAWDLPIAAIKSVLVERADGTLRQRVLGVLDERIQEYALRIAILQGHHDDLDSRYHALLTTPPDRPSDCICDAVSSKCTCLEGASES